MLLFIKSGFNGKSLLKIVITTLVLQYKYCSECYFFVAVPDYEIVQIHSVRHKRSASALEDVHRVNLATHGRQLRLELKPNHHLVPRQRDLDLWYADAFPTNVSYSPADNVSIEVA